MTKKTNGRSKPQDAPQPVDHGLDAQLTESNAAFDREFEKPNPFRFGEHVETIGIDSTNFDRAIEQVQRLFERLSPRHLKACSRPLCAGTVVAVLDAADGTFERLCELHFQLVLDVLDRASPPINDPWRAEFESLPPALQYGLEGR